MKRGTRQMTDLEREIWEARQDPEAAHQIDDWRASMDLARELQARLDDSGLSLREVAKRMGTSPTQVGRILRLETKISIATLWKFARVLGCTVAVCVSKDVAPATKKDDTVPHELLESICRRLQRIEERMGLQAASGETEFRVVTPSIPAARFTDEEDDASAWKRPN